MPKTPAQRAAISRQNGAKSRGPVTPEGKEKSARNAIEHGRRAESLKHFAPPHFAVLCNEERREFYQLLDEITASFQPRNAFARSLVRDIAVARWSILRLETHMSNQWNFALMEHARPPRTVAPELAELEVIARANRALYTGTSVLSRMNRELDRLHVRVARLERTLRTIHTHYPAEVPERTRQNPAEVVENASSESEKDAPEQPIFITENTPKVIEFYRAQFPGRRIVVLPADDVAKGIGHDDDMPDIPRKVA